MSEQSSNIVSKVWGLCNPLRDDGVSYGDYLEQLTYLIFLKMSDEYSRPPYKRETGIPKGYTWSDMNTLKGAELENQYRAILERLGDEGGILGQIFKGAVNKISNVSILYRVVQMIDKENWVSCAGVIFTHPVPNSLSTYSSAITGISRPTSGRTSILPTKSLYLSSSGLTATAVSPNNVSGRVVAIIT